MYDFKLLKKRRPVQQRGMTVSYYGISRMFYNTMGHVIAIG